MQRGKRVESYGRSNAIFCLLFLLFLSYNAGGTTIAPGQEPAGSTTPGGNASLLPPGPGRDLTIKVCSGCHLPVIAAKQGLSKQGWSDLVDVMSARGAVATDKELDQITDYLARSFPPAAPGRGPKLLPPPQTSENANLLPPGPGRDLTVRVCSSCHSASISAKQRLSEPEWSDLVQLMSSRGAVATDKELDQITAYLAKSFPADTNQKTSNHEPH